MNLIRQSIKACCTAVLPRRLFLARGPLRSRNGIEAALSFDDGPDPRTTPGLLDLLENKGITATFFLIGEKAARHRGIVQRIVSAGHDLGNHSYTHSEPDQTSTVRFIDEIRKTRELLEEIGNRPCRLVRPPKGVLSMAKQFALWREGMTVVLWNVDPRDYQMQSMVQAETWGAAYRPRGGDILLLHDNHRWASGIVRTVADNVQQYANRVRFVRLSTWV